MDNLNSILLILFIMGLFYNILKFKSKNSKKITAVKILSYLIVIGIIVYYMVFIFGNSKPV